MNPKSEQFQQYSEIPVDAALVPWETGSLSLWSLWKMLESYAWNLVQYTDTLTWLRQSLEARLTAAQNGTRDLDAASITDNDRNNFKAVFETFRPWLEAHTLTASLDQSTRILDEINESEPDIHALISGLKHFNTTLEDELRRRVFLYVAPEDIGLYRYPYASFGLTQAAYPSARNDIHEACRSFALGRYTACVFHCMGIVQSGLHTTAQALGVTFPYSIELAEWSAVIGRIDDKIKEMREGQRTNEKDDKLSFYSECATQFRYFKDAWRNHVCHLREVYDRDQAHSILLHVRDFMEKLSTRIKETYVPVPYK
jgi:HEPN domain-containing protein